MNGQIDQRLLVFDSTRVADGLLFATHRDRCCYLGMTLREKPQWLKENSDKCRSLADVEAEAARLTLAVENKTIPVAGLAEPNGQTSSRDVRTEDGEEDITLVDTLARDRSPPHEPTSLLTPVTATLTNRPTKAELLPPPKATIDEAEGPRPQATPLGAIGRKQGRGAGRHLTKQKPPADVSGGQKLSPERMRTVIDSLREYAVLSHAASKAGIHRKTLEYWLKHSEAGDDGYDIEYEGVEWRFHEHCQIAIEEAHDKILAAMWKIAMGDPDVLRKDEYGTPIPVNARKVAKMLIFLAKTLLPEKYGKRRKIDVPHHCGVLVIGGADSRKPNKGSAASVEARKWKAAMRMIGETES
jgi:hypothetical protein